MHNHTTAGITLREIRHWHCFGGIGAGARGFNRGTARVGNLQATFRCIGGVDVSGAAIRDFSRLAGVPGTVLDLSTGSNIPRFTATNRPRNGGKPRPPISSAPPAGSGPTWSF
jgi:hypothetical protein